MIIDPLLMLKMRVQITLRSLVLYCTAGLVSSDLVRPPLTSLASLTKFDERNVDGWRDFCRDFSHGDPITGEFTTPGYPHAYPADTECVRVIHAPVDYTILIDFRGTFFEVEKSDENHKSRISSLSTLEKIFMRDSLLDCPFDYLEVRNGAYGFSPLIGRYCGDRFPPVIAADSGSMWLLFRSDHTIEHRGFRAVHYASPKIEAPDTTKYRSHICSFASTVFDDAPVYVGTDEIRKVHPDLFANRTPTSPIECLWKVETRSRAHKLRLQFDAFDLLYPNECSLNSMEIYAFTTSRSHLVKQFCGRIATYVDTRSYLAYVRIFLTESSFSKTVIRASFTPYARGKDCNESTTMFTCGDETCVPRALVCNGRADCLSSLDERKCGRGGRPLFNFFNGQYLVILVVIILLIIVIVVCAVVINVWHRIKKRRILYAPVKKSESSHSAPSANREVANRSAPVPPLGLDSPIYRHRSLVPKPIQPLTMSANGAIELMHSTHVPDSKHQSPPPSSSKGRLCEFLPTISHDDIHLFLCRRGYYATVDSLGANSTDAVRAGRPFYSPFCDRKLQTAHAPISVSRSPALQFSADTGTLSSKLWALTPSTTRLRPSDTAESTVAYCSSQSIAAGSAIDKVSRHSGADKSTHDKRSKRKSILRPPTKKLPKLTTSKAYYQTRSSSSSRNEAQQAPTHKFWARVEDLITTTEDSSDGGRRASPSFDNAANLSDLTNRQSSSDVGTSEESDQEGRLPGHEWALNEADSILESEPLKLERGTYGHVPGELILSV